MRIKLLSAALVLSIAISWLQTVAAEAAAVTQDATWRTGRSGTVLIGSEGISATGSGEMSTELAKFSEPMNRADGSIQRTTAPVSSVTRPMRAADG